MMGNGIRIVKMALVFIHTQSEKNMREIGSTDRNMEKVHIITKMGINILEIGLKIRKTDEEFLSIQVVQFMMESGLMIRHAIKVRLFILAKINMKEIS
jgi:hypothetical protein